MNYITGLGRDLGDPDFIVTIKPESRMVQDIDFQSLLDSASNRFHRKCLGKLWKHQVHAGRRYTLIAQPEKQSKRTTGNQSPALHYHGRLWVKNGKLVKGFLNGCFETIVRELMNEKYPDVHICAEHFWIQKYKPELGDRDAGYAYKSVGFEFKQDETYVSPSRGWIN